MWKINPAVIEVSTPKRQCTNAADVNAYFGLSFGRKSIDPERRERTIDDPSQERTEYVNCNEEKIRLDAHTYRSLGIKFPGKRRWRMQVTPHTVWMDPLTYRTPRIV